jgi:hypothetical protein
LLFSVLGVLQFLSLRKIQHCHVSDSARMPCQV